MGEKIGEKRGEESVWLGGRKWGRRVFSSSPPFKRKKFFTQLRKKLERKVGRE